MAKKTAMRDLIVLLPGITGSILVDEKGDEVWNASGEATWSYLRSIGRSLDKLVVASHPAGQDTPPGKLRASALLPGIHGVFGLGRIDGYRALATMIRDNFDVAAATADPEVPANTTSSRMTGA